MELGLFSNRLFFIFKPSQMDLVYKLQILLCQYKFTFYKAKACKNFRKFTRFFQTCLASNKFSSNSRAVLLPGILIEIMFGL
jgi:hypothetical protein